MYTSEDIFSLMDDLEGVGLSETPDEFSLRILNEYIKFTKDNPREGTHYYETLYPTQVGSVSHMDIYRTRFQDFKEWLATKNITPTYLIFQCRLRHVNGWPKYFLTLPMVKGKVIDIFDLVNFRRKSHEEVKSMIKNPEGIVSYNVMDYYPQEQTSTYEPFKIAHKISYQSKPGL